MNYLERNIKAFKSLGTSLWPFGRPASTPFPTTSRNYGTPFINYQIFNNTPRWQSLSGFSALMNCFRNNPVFYAVVMIKAREMANMRIKVCNRVTGEYEPEGTTKPIPAKIYSLFNKPNVEQSRWEFLQQKKIHREVCGNSMVYGNFAMGLPKSPLTCSALFDVWPEYMEVKLKGKYFSATDINEIIEGWKFKFGTYSETWTPNEIMHNNAPNLDPKDGLIFGSATALSLIRPLSNIEMAYESRNVIMQNRGMMAILSSARGDGTGRISLQPNDKKIIQEELDNYGLREGQRQFFLSSEPLEVTPINQDVKRLGLFEEIATDAMLVCNAFGVPEILLKLYLQGATFENQEASLRRLYQGTLIPEMEDDLIAFNSFLGLDGTEWKIEGDFSHVACLQEDEKRKADTNKVLSDQMINELAKNIITIDEYRAAMNYPQLEKPKTDPNAPPETGADAKTLEAQANLRGSVGGVQGILAIQAGVVAGTTTYDSGLSMLTIVYGFTEEQAKDLLGDPQSSPSTGSLNGNKHHQPILN